ncbi:hypothetical protein RAM80_20985 [Pseudomonas sp. App30]|uniref:hypothetical protein n=1 Tax=Pseudomonas sp. App30 TaxID=3068990 RepID=UPI003A80BC9C
MGFVLAILVGLFGHKLLQTKLFAGGYSLGQAFWGFGVLGGMVLLAVAGGYVAHVAHNDQSSGAGWTLAAIRGVATPVGLYAFVAFMGIWRSARHSDMWVKIVSRYFSVFFLSTAGACVMFGWFNMLIAGGVFLLKQRVQRNRALKALANAEEA